jgi:hypothetical protein
MLCLSLWTIGCAKKKKEDFAKELSRKLTVGHSQAEAEKVLDQYGFTHSFDLRTRTIYAIKRMQGSGLVKEDWQVIINVDEGRNVNSINLKKIFTGP